MSDMSVSGSSVPMTRPEFNNQMDALRNERTSLDRSVSRRDIAYNAASIVAAVGLFPLAISGCATGADSGRPLGKSDEEYTSDLLNAAYNGDLGSVNNLLKMRINVNAKDNDGVTALIVAAQKGHIDIVNALISANADTNAKINDGVTALMFAAERGHTDIAKLLINARADVNAKANDGVTALIVALHRGHFDIMRLLISAGATLFIRDD